jgi:hypothetical protein
MHFSIKEDLLRLRFSRPLLAAVAVMTIGCSGCRSVPDVEGVPAVDDIRQDGADVKLLEAGRSIYTGRCTYCHAMRPIFDYEAEDWSDRILPLMTKKARLTRRDAEALGLYVLTARAAAPAADKP